MDMGNVVLRLEISDTDMQPEMGPRRLLVLALLWYVEYPCDYVAESSDGEWRSLRVDRCEAMKNLVVRLHQLLRTLAQPFKNAGFTAWAILLLIPVAALAIIFALAGSRPPAAMSADDFKTNSFAIGLIRPEQMSQITLAADPTLDLAPSLDRVLHGQIRMPFRAVPNLTQENPGPVFFWSLPRSAEIDISPAFSFSFQDGTFEHPWYSCSNSTTGISMDLRHEGKLYKDLIRVDCGTATETRIVLFPPGGLSEDESRPESFGSYTQLAWAPTLDFRVPKYPGITEQADGSIRYVIPVDQARLKDQAVFEYDDAKDLPHRPLVSLTPWGEGEHLQPDVPTNISTPHYAEFGDGTSSVSSLSEDQVFFTATGSVKDTDPSLLSWAGANPWVMLLLGALLGAAVPSFQKVIRTGLRRLPPWKP